MRRWSLLITLASLGGCETSPVSPRMDLASADLAIASPVRTLVVRPLYGDVHPQNLLIDPNFSVRQPGLGVWTAIAGFGADPAPTLISSPMSDSPDGIALPVAQLSSESGAALDLIAQVPGGPRPFHLRVWISTLDATQSADVSAAAPALLTALGGTAFTDGTTFPINEDATQAKVIAGRTWHLFTGDITQDLLLGAFVDFSFSTSNNTWLLQAPEFIPRALDPTPTAEILRRGARDGHGRPMNEREKALVLTYVSQPRPSVPAKRRSRNEE